MAEKPKVNSDSQKELEKVEAQFKAYDENIKEMTQDRMNMAPKVDQDNELKMSGKEIDKLKDVYLKPKRSISSQEKFNEKWREQYNFSKEYVRFTPKHNELIGETVEIWTKPFPGMPAEYWEVPIDKPLWGPRYLAEQMVNCKYHRLKMQQNVVTSQDSVGQMYGALAVDTVVQRLDAVPVSTRRSVFMGASNF
jgi:hypothetical protein